MSKELTKSIAAAVGAVTIVSFPRELTPDERSTFEGVMAGIKKSAKVLDKVFQDKTQAAERVVEYEEVVANLEQKARTDHKAAAEHRDAVAFLKRLVEEASGPDDLRIEARIVANVRAALNDATNAMSPIFSEILTGHRAQIAEGIAPYYSSPDRAFQMATQCDSYAGFAHWAQYWAGSPMSGAASQAASAKSAIAVLEALLSGKPLWVFSHSYTGSAALAPALLLKPSSPAAKE